MKAAQQAVATTSHEAVRSNVVALRRPNALLAARASDREFLPAALEVTESPPSPRRVALLLTICALFAAGLMWSWFGRVEIYATAQGKVQPTGKVKVVQPLESGKIAKVYVAEGARVAAGDTLLEIDATEARADRNAALQDVILARAEAVRRAAALAAVRSGSLMMPSGGLSWSADIPAGIRANQEAVLSAELGELSSTLGNLEAQKAQKAAEYARLEGVVSAQAALIAILRERMGMREELYRRQTSSRASVIDATQDVLQAETTLATQKGQLGEVTAATRTLESAQRKAIDTFLNETTQKLSDVLAKADEATQRLAKASARLERTRLTAPIAGTVQALSVTTVGQVVTTGQELLRVVPEDASLEIEVSIPNKDIGFVELEQDAVIKVDAFPFTRYGTIAGVVKRLASDSSSGADASRISSGVSRGAFGDAGIPADASAGLVFTAIVMPKETSIQVGRKSVPLSPGMSVVVEIKTGDRRLIDYVLSPLIEVGSKAFSER